jgi:hypothetical protein
MRNTAEKLGPLQKKILIHIFQNDHEESVSHLAEYLKRQQPTIFKSVRLLHRYNYLESMLLEHYFGTVRRLGVTDKGAAAAVTLGITFNQIEDYHHYKPFTFLKNEELAPLWNMVKSHDQQDDIIKKAMHYALENNFFDTGQFRKLSHSESEKLKLFIVLESITSSAGIPTLRNFVNKYNLDKKLLKEFLNKQKQYIESLMRELN